MIHESILARLPVPNGGALLLTKRGVTYAAYHIMTDGSRSTMNRYYDGRQAMSDLMDTWYDMSGGSTK